MKLEPQWIAGFIEGEGSFNIDTHRVSDSSLQSQAEFIVVQGKVDVQVLYGMKSFFKCGEVTVNRVDQTSVRMQYRVKDIESLHNVIVPFLIKQRFRTKKHIELIRFRRVVRLLYLKYHKHSVESSLQIARLGLDLRVRDTKEPYEFKEGTSVRKVYDKLSKNVEDAKASSKATTIVVAQRSRANSDMPLLNSDSVNQTWQKVLKETADDIASAISNYDEYLSVLKESNREISELAARCIEQREFALSKIDDSTPLPKNDKKLIGDAKLQKARLQTKELEVQLEQARFYEAKLISEYPDSLTKVYRDEVEFHYPKQSTDDAETSTASGDSASDAPKANRKTRRSSK